MEKNKIPDEIMRHEWLDSFSRRLNIQRDRITTTQKIALIALALSLASNVIALVNALS